MPAAGGYRNPGAARPFVIVSGEYNHSIPPALSKAIPLRGVRGDASTEGQGIGLAIVQDILRVYHADLHITASPWGGARVTVRFPG